MGAKTGENRFEAFQKLSSEAVIKSIVAVVNQLQKINVSFPNIHHASICVAESLKTLEDQTLHRSPSTLLKNPNFRLCIIPLVQERSSPAEEDRYSLIAKIKIRRLEDENKRLTKALTLQPKSDTQIHAPSENLTDSGDTNKLCVVISEMLKHADFLFDVDKKQCIITKAGKYSSDRFITTSSNNKPYFDWLERKELILQSIGADSKKAVD